MKAIPKIPPYLLWEFDLNSFDYQKSAKIVIERVIENGTIEDWREMVRFYGRDVILETTEWSSQLSRREKYFTTLFLDSGFLKCS